MVLEGPCETVGTCGCGLGRRVRGELAKHLVRSRCGRYMKATSAGSARTVMTRSSCIWPSECGCFPSATSQREYRESVQHVMLRTCR